MIRFWLFLAACCVMYLFTAALSIISIIYGVITTAVFLGMAYFEHKIATISN